MFLIKIYIKESYINYYHTIIQMCGQYCILAPTAGHDHNSFDAVGIIKQTTDTRDKFYIYRIRNRNPNGGSD